MTAAETADSHLEGAIAATQRWLERAVIGLNLCPFAKAVHSKGRVRWVLCRAQDEAALLRCLEDELQLLAATDPDAVDTTLIVHPRVLGDFLDYNDFLDVADAALEDLGLDGTLQIASFHPAYQFAGTEADDITNCSNRSPFPTLHLLREASIDAAVAAVSDAADIFERNVQTLEQLGWAGWHALQETPDGTDHSPRENNEDHSQDHRNGAPGGRVSGRD